MELIFTQQPDPMDQLSGTEEQCPVAVGEYYLMRSAEGGNDALFVCRIGQIDEADGTKMAWTQDWSLEKTPRKKPDPVGGRYVVDPTQHGNRAR